MLAILALTGEAQGTAPGRRRPTRKPAALGLWAVACPRCGVEPGAPCDRRTLGRFNYHKARKDAWEAGNE